MEENKIIKKITCISCLASGSWYLTNKKTCVLCKIKERKMEMKKLKGKLLGHGKTYKECAYV